MSSQSSARRRVDLLLLLVIITALAIAAFGIWRTLTAPAGYEVQWATENALDILGFNIYRADRADGEYVRLTPALVGVGGDPLTNETYRFLDTDVERGARYYYKIETIYRDGRSELSAQPIVIPAP